MSQQAQQNSHERGRTIFISPTVGSAPRTERRNAVRSADPTIRRSLWCILFAITFPTVLHAGLPPAPPLPEIPPKDEPGVLLTITGQTAPPAPDVRVSRLVSLYIPSATAPSSLTPPGRYQAKFEGDISMRLRDFVMFSAIGKGKLTLTINDKPALDLSGDLAGKSSESVRLNKGKNHLIARYEPAPNADAELRLFWATKYTLPEPVPPNVISHSNADKSLRESQRIRDGRSLIAQLRCIKCHAAPEAAHGMPELAMDAPSLADVGARLETNWIAAWISNPRKLRATAHMPRLFASTDAIAPEARDIAAYLATLGSPKNAPESGKAEAGGQLFANLNCVACHISPERQVDAQENADRGRISLAHIKAKFKPGALKAFLLNPSAHYAWISMPNFRLSDAEADNLATYLRSFEGQPLAPAQAGDPRNGERLIYSAGCVKCHAVDPKAAPFPSAATITLSAIPAEGWTRGCMGADATARKTAPDFSLTDEQRIAILAFAATDRSSLNRDTPSEFSQRQVVALRCTACHARDGKESLLATDLDAENQELRNKFPPPQQSGEGIAPDQRAPMLTWAGEKLRPEWMHTFIAGGIPYKPRYYLRARMPGFATRAELLAQGIAAEHGCAPTYPPYGPPDKKLAEIGQTLVGKAPNASFGCVQCHSIQQQAALAPFEAPAINFMHVSERLREDYYYRWIHDPLRIDPETKMPRFDDADGKTGVPIFDNDARKQFQAIWNYLLLGKDITPPAQ